MESEEKLNKDPKKAQPRARLFLALTTIVMTIVGIAIITANLTGSIQFVTVLSNTMSPTVTQGSLAIVKPTPPADVREGDIVALGLNTVNDTRISRVSSISSEEGVYSYTLWSENAQMQDPWLHRTLNNIDVIVWSVPVIGWITLVLSNPIFLILLLGASIYYARYYTMKIFSYNSRQVHARRIAEERLENIKYGGMEDLISTLTEETDSAIVKIGRETHKVSDLDAYLKILRSEENRALSAPQGGDKVLEEVKEAEENGK